MEDRKRHPSNMMWAGVVIGALVLCSVLATRTAAERGWNRYLPLIRSGATCQGTIVRTSSDNNCRADYSFSIGGKNYTGTGWHCQAAAGQKVTVTYLPDDPSQSCLGPAGETMANEVVSSVFGGLYFPSID